MVLQSFATTPTREDFCCLSDKKSNIILLGPSGGVGGGGANVPHCGLPGTTGVGGGGGGNGGGGPGCKPVKLPLQMYSLSRGFAGVMQHCPVIDLPC